MKGTFNNKEAKIQSGCCMHESDENGEGEQNRVNKGWQEKKEGRHHHGSGI
jgi:hypothetical protein